MSNPLTDLAQALERAHIPYMVIGGQAVLVYGEPRLTRDIDVTLGLEPVQLPLVLGVVQEMDLRVLVGDPAAFVEKTWVLPTLHESSGLRVDFIFSWTPYESQAIERAHTVTIGGVPVRFAASEDVIIHKMLAGRPRDLEDVRTILRKQTVDVAYIRDWLPRFADVAGQDILETFEQLYREVQDGL
ncbi:MAG: nucleotidyltransferase [Deltaproteobacteria bacterium]|nr:nucleotidyltransferase [Deltaproteobacteria bacterium]MBW2137900.1 nucleotidyltransferase [Deltaproteobacteria bacterium]